MALVSGDHAGGLAADDAADSLDDFDDALGGRQAVKAGDGIELIQRAAGQAEAAPGDHRDPEAEAGQQRRERQGDFVPNATGGVLVHQGARVIRKAQHVARVPHGEHERAGFGLSQAAKIDGHQEGGHLVVRDLAGGIGGDGLLDLGRVKVLTVPLRLDEGEEIHAPELAHATEGK